MASNVYTGRWTDHSKHPVLADQITLASSSSNVLIAFIALFITFIGGIAWSTLAYIVHQLRVTRKESAAFDHQLQAILRTYGSPTTFAYKTLDTALGWRRVKTARKTVLLKACSFATLALVISLSFSAAGISLSAVSQTGDVLLQSPFCGELNTTLADSYTSTNLLALNLAIGAEGAENSLQALNYARVCYPSFGSTGEAGQTMYGSAADCNYYTKPVLNWTTTHPLVCPFGAGVCRGPSTDIVQFDTGLLDTNTDLGLNTAASDRMQFRRVTTCAPIVTQGFSTNFTNTSTIGDVATYWYGPNINQPLVVPWEGWQDNVTFVYPYENYISKSQAYQVLVAAPDIGWYTGPGDVSTTYRPDPRIASNTSLVSLLFLANRAYYSEPVEDPWFHATTPFVDTNEYEGPGSAGVTYYYNTQPGTVLGCLQQITICNPVLPSNSCIDWDGAYEYAYGGANTSLDALQLNKHQTSLAHTIAGALQNSGFAHMFTNIGTPALLASQYLFEGSIVSTPLPLTHWIAELQNLHAVSMSLIQRTVISIALGPSDPIIQKVFVHPASTAWGCSIQRFKSNAYSSFSVLSLGLIFGLGGFIVLLSIIVRLIVPWTQKRLKKGKYLRQQWYANELLHLQRLAFEGQNLGDWKESEEDEVPVTKTYTKFVSFTNSTQHPQDNGASDGSSMRAALVKKFGRQTMTTSKLAGTESLAVSATPSLTNYASSSRYSRVDYPGDYVEEDGWGRNLEEQIELIRIESDAHLS